MQRGSIVLVSISGDYGKVRPALVIQNDRTIAHFDSLTVCLLTSHDEPTALLRIPIAPSASNGLNRPSYVQIEKIMSVPKAKVRQELGVLDASQIRQVDLGLSLHLNLFAPAERDE